jgi:hypothetical protein
MISRSSEMMARALLETFWNNRRRELIQKQVFYFSRRNPLKSLDSAKEKQGNARPFAWIPLDFPCQ